LNPNLGGDGFQTGGEESARGEYFTAAIRAIKPPWL
jgi:hypothetical protein